MRKNILILISEKKNNDNFINWIKEIFGLENLDIFVIDNNLEKLDTKLLTADYILNFIEDKEKYEYIQKKIELLKIPFFGNNLIDIKLFSEKNNFKKIINKSKFKTPVFEKISKNNPLDLFNNFPQPSRIFSNENKFFSGKLSSPDDLKNIFDKNSNLEDCFIEEFIDGKEIYVLSFMFYDERIILPVINNNGNFERIEKSLEEEIKNNIKDFFKYSDIKSFALFNLMYSEKRGLYFLNIFINNSIIYKYSNLLEEILEIHKYLNLKKIFKRDLF